MLRPGVGRHAARGCRFEPELGGRGIGLGFGLGVTPASPGHQDPAEPEERGGVLRHDGQRGESTGGDEVKPPGGLGPLFDPRGDDRDILRSAHRRRGAQELTLARVRLDQEHARLGKRDGERESWKSRSRAEVGDPQSSPHGLELQ
jgi:hypothetical protein